MRGRPFIQWLMFVAVWLLLVIPVWRVTRPSAHAARAGGAADDAEALTWISVRFSAVPSYFAIRQEDRMLWEEDAPDDVRFEKAVGVMVDAYGVELLFSAILPDAETAVEITLEPSEGRRQSRTVWGRGEIEEPVSFVRGRDE